MSAHNDGVAVRCKLVHLRLAHPNLHRREFFQDREIRMKGDGTQLGSSGM